MLWTDQLPAAAEWGHELAQPWDDAPSFDPAEAPEVDTALRLNGDRAMIRQPAGRFFRDFRSDPDAYRHLSTLPGPGETLHGVISGKYALFELIPALIERTGSKIEDLYIATLSFNKQNAADILSLLDAGHVKRLNLIISYYYRSTSREIYDLLIPPLRERGQRTLAIRNHAKLLLASMGNGSRYTVESSANLRSSVNIEQFAMTDGADLYNFHKGWLEELFATQKDLGE